MGNSRWERMAVALEDLDSSLEKLDDQVSDYFQADTGTVRGSKVA